MQRGHGRPGDTQHPCSLACHLRPLRHQGSTQQRQAHSGALFSCPSSRPVLHQVGHISSVFRPLAICGYIWMFDYVPLSVLDLDLLRSFWAEMISQACRVPVQDGMTFVLSCWIMSLRLFILISNRLIATGKTGIWLFSER